MAEIGEIDLLGRLERVSPDLAGRIRRLGDTVDPLLARIYSIFPAYTDHGRSHSEQVMSILSWLLPSDMATTLSAQEMFYLLGGALLHDIGMLGAVDEAGDPESQRRIRDSHHLRSQQYVKEHYQQLGLDRPEANAIAEICRAHRKINIAENVSDIPGIGGSVIRMQLLCAAVRIADELHLTADRAPQIVLDAIRVSRESAAHFKKHLSITGVGPLDPSRADIRISATVETPAQERALHQMAHEIQEKLTEVGPVFAKHNLTWRIDLKLERRKVVEHKVALHLARFGECHRNALAVKLDESPSDIETCLQDLADLHFIQSGEEPEYVSLVADNHTFEYLLGQFLKTEDELEFASSPYLHECLKEFAFDDFRQRFDAVYDLQERDDRVLVLRSSPTALYLLLFAAEFQQVESTIIPRRAILDRAILLGFLMDVFRFPQIAGIRGIEAAVMAIQSKIGQDSQHLLRLLKALGPDVGRDLQDVFNDLVPPPELEDIDSGDRHKFRLTVSHPRIALKRGMTFPHLLKAAMISGEPLELVGDKVQLSFEDPRLSKATTSHPDYLVITPHLRRTSPQGGVIFCRVEIDCARRRITLFADMERSTDYSKYPIAIRMTIPSDRRNATFRPSVYFTNIDVRQALQIDEMFRWIMSGDFHRLRIEPDQVEPLPSDIMPLEALGSDLKDQTIEPFLDDPHRDVLKCLARLQGRAGERIPLPLRLATQQEVDITELAKAPNDVSVTQIRDELLLIAGQSKDDLTTIRVSTYFPNGQIESDEFLGPFPRIIPKIESKQSEINQQLAEMLQKGEGAIRVTHGFALDLATLRKTIVESFSEAGQWAFLPPRSESEQAARTFCQVTIQPIQDKMWYREQVIHYQLRDVSAVNSIYSDASRLLEQDRVQQAIDKLTEALQRFPKEPVIPGHLGWAHYKAGNLDAAYEYSREAVTNPEDEKWSMRIDFAYYNLGLCSLLLGRFDESISWYEEAIRSGAGPVLNESIEDLRAVLTTEIPEALCALAFLYEHKGDLSKAIKLYGQFLGSDSQHEKYKELTQAAIERLEQSEQAQ